MYLRVVSLQMMNFHAHEPGIELPTTCLRDPSRLSLEPHDKQRKNNLFPPTPSNLFFENDKNVSLTSFNGLGKLGKVGKENLIFISKYRLCCLLVLLLAQARQSRLVTPLLL